MQDGNSAVDVTTDRLGKIGGSDLAAILGADRYCTPYQAWRRITGKDGPQETNRHMRRGKCLERGVADYFAQDMAIGPDTDEGLPRKPLFVHRVPRLVHPEHDFLVGHPDFVLADDLNGQLYVMEVKCPERMDWEIPPDNYTFQLNYYGGLVRANPSRAFSEVDTYQRGYEYDINRSGLLAVACGSINPFWQPFDPDMYAAHVHQAAEWHKAYVQTDTPPPFTTEADVAIAHPESEEGRKLEAANEDADWLGSLIGIDAEIKALEEQKKVLTEKLKCMLGPAEALVRGDKVLATWKSHDKQGIDWNGMRQAHPQIVEAFTVNKPVRTLLLKHKEIAAFAGGV